MKYTIDTEFNGFGGELMSLALYGENDMRSLYLVLPYIQIETLNPWVRENVVPYLYDCPKRMTVRVNSRWEAARMVWSFLVNDLDVEIVADWPDDISYLCNLLITSPGQMVPLDKLRFRLERVDAYPSNIVGAVQHNAWWDAKALKAKLLETGRM